MKRRLTFLIGSMLSVAALLWAVSAGPNSAGLGANVAGAGIDWLTPTNIYLSDDARATTALAASDVSDLLRSTTYGFAIPAGSTINGWVAEFERSKSGAGTCEDFSVRAVKAGVEVGAENAVAGAWPGADAYLAYGNATYKWATTWTPAEINAVGFGVSIAAQETTGAGACTARVDHVRITVYYTLSSGRKAYIINAQRREAGRIVGGPLPVGTSIPLDVDSHGLMFAHVGVNGKDRLFSLDTSATTAISTRLGATVTRKETVRAATAFKTVLVQLDYAQVTLKLGNRYLATEVMVRDLSHL
jgi:hypothetical protein